MMVHLSKLHPCSHFYYLPIINMKIEIRKYDITLSDHQPCCDFSTHGVGLHWSPPLRIRHLVAESVVLQQRAVVAYCWRQLYIRYDNHPMRPNNLIQIALGPLVFACFWPPHGLILDQLKSWQKRKQLCKN